ncbi:MAG TPA: lytic transglycosylase domain-containing protein [Xanthobacteraceae bacterium]|nr:lytic transglycosylase domain-containing protein [Xanthobacteraceae bacterium]
MNTRYRSALVAALACASALAITLAAEPAAARGAKGAHTTAKASGKAAKATGKKVAGKSKDKAAPEKSVVPQIPLAHGPPPQTSAADTALVKSAIETLRHGGASKATEVAATISDPVARKLVEWIILRSDHSGADSKRFLGFIAGNPGWPNLGMFRKRAEAMLWVENIKPAQALSFFNGSPPQSGTGRLVLARALIAQGDIEAAKPLIREAWRDHSLSAEVEKQVLERYSEFLTRADHKARMEKRVIAADNEAALRVARRLGAADLAIAQARIAINRKGADVKKLLDAVPADARHDPDYLLAKTYVLRHENKIAEAAQVLLSAPCDLDEIHDGEEWWVERRIMARKLLDLGDARSAYRVVAEAAEPTKENSRIERHFMAGWIALRFLDDPQTAATHFKRIQDVTRHPTSYARSHYWLGRVAEALHQPEQARAEYETAARGSAAYYGQLARARLGLPALALAPPPPKPDKEAEAQRLELVRALEILYALNERQLVITLMASIGESVNDPGTLSALGELAEQYEDARGMLHMGKGALARGLPLDYYAFPTVGVPRYSPIASNIENAMLFAIIRQESAFDPSDWSQAQAMGLMQVTPEAGKDTCKRFGCTYDFKRLRTDSPYNLQVGAAEIAGVLQDYRGNQLLAFAAYNAGRGRVQEWIAKYGDPRDPKVDPVDWVERIPFMETRNYVQRVMENFQVYRVRFANDAPLTIDKDLRRDAAAR